MSRPRVGWWGYMKYIIRRYPGGGNEDEDRAVAEAIAETERMRAGRDRLQVARMVLMEGSHTLEGAALQIPISPRTAQRYHADFIRCVGRHFRCSGLEYPAGRRPNSGG